MKIQAYLEAVAVNLKRLVSFFFAPLAANLTGMTEPRSQVAMRTARY
jgi:hypothetical protein